jgi:membrane-associated protease RseP (regulator of RpoE activity)
MPRAVARARTWPRIPFLNLSLFFATVLTTLWAGGLPNAGRLLAAHGVSSVLADAAAIAVAGMPFATALIGILLCHEMGHYLLARAHGVDSTLPFFIPVPIGPIGTFGAVIRIRSAMPSRRATLDIGAAGPFAGFIVALPLYAWGLAHSEVRPVGDAALEVPSMGVVSIVRDWIAGVDRPSLDLINPGDSLVTWCVKHLVLGKLPAGSTIFEHPVAFAAWIGLFITALNLIPLGQLDGGHVTYALLGGRRARALSRLVSWGLLASGLLLSWTWLVWWAVTRFLVRFGHPPALEEGPLDVRRKVFAVLALLLFVATFIPVPISN